MKIYMKKNTNKKYKLYKKVLILSLVGIMQLNSGCSKKMDCDIKEDHAHLYENENHFYTYLNGENATRSGYKWTPNSISIDEATKKKLDFLEDNNLVPIAMNQRIIDSIVHDNTDFIEYEYVYEVDEIAYYLSPSGGIAYSSVSVKTSIDSSGRPLTETVINMPVYKKSPRKDFIKDENIDGKTGVTRDVSYEYYAYKIEKKKTVFGEKFVKVKSDTTDQLNTLSKEYKYIDTDDFYKYVYSEPDLQKVYKK
ncbi:MAG: hypothetical protein PHN72_02235 [Bacilli bacterium]|nr:hypothetical protein [Bacilli bacterium]